jgi:hypothetical protein
MHGRDIKLNEPGTTDIYCRVGRDVMTLALSIIGVVTTQEQFINTGAMKTRMGYFITKATMKIKAMSHPFDSHAPSHPPRHIFTILVESGTEGHAHTPLIDGIDLCALAQTFSLRHFKYTLTVEDGFRPRNIG